MAKLLIDKKKFKTWCSRQFLKFSVCTVISKGYPPAVSVTQNNLLLGVPQTVWIMLLLAIKKHLGDIPAVAFKKRDFIPLIIYSSLFQNFSDQRGCQLIKVKYTKLNPQIK